VDEFFDNEEKTTKLYHKLQKEHPYAIITLTKITTETISMYWG